MSDHLEEMFGTIAWVPCAETFGQGGSITTLHAYRFDWDNAQWMRIPYKKFAYPPGGLGNVIADEGAS